MDKALYRMTWALKDGRSFADTKNRLREPCEALITGIDRRCPALAPDRILVPVPRKMVTPASPDPGDWPGLRIANALHAAGLGRSVVIALRRHTAVAGSTGKASLANRDTVQLHIASLTANVRLVRGETKVTLVDDTLVTGTQFVGAMRALHIAGFQGSIVAFAAFAALSNELARPRNIHAAIEWDGAEGWAHRRDG